MTANTYQTHIKRVLAGHKNAYAEIVAMFRDMARTVSTARVNEPSLAEDAVQEAFLTAYRKLASLDDPEAFPGWFRTILIRHCDRLREQRDRERAMPGDMDLPAPADADPSLTYTRRLDRIMVRRILETLPGVAREACIQRYVHGRPYDDIARLLGVPTGTVKRRLHDARRKIIAEVQAQRGRAIRIGYLPISDHLLAMVAHARREDPDTSVVLRRYLSWSCLTRDLVSGAVDGAFIMAPLAMNLRNKGVPLVYVLDGHHDGSAITVRPDAQSCNLADLRMGLPHVLSTQRVYLHGLVGVASCTEAEAMRNRYISPSYLGRYFEGREVDAFFCAEPWHTKSEVEGKGRVLTRSRDFDPGHVCCGLVVREPFAQHSGHLVHDYVAELLAAAEYAVLNPDECADIQARYTGVPRDIARHILRRGHVTFSDLLPNKGRLRQSMDLALRSSVLDSPCNLDTFLSTEYG